MTPSGVRSIVNDAIAVYFADATIASAFVARWCAGHKAEAVDGIFRVRESKAPRRNRLSQRALGRPRVDGAHCIRKVEAPPP